MEYTLRVKRLLLGLKSKVNSLNPYSTGIRLEHIKDYEVHFRKHVLILILLEYE